MCLFFFFCNYCRDPPLFFFPSFQPTGKEKTESSVNLSSPSFPFSSGLPLPSFFLNGTGKGPTHTFFFEEVTNSSLFFPPPSRAFALSPHLRFFSPPFSPLFHPVSPGSEGERGPFLFLPLPSLLFFFSCGPPSRKLDFDKNSPTSLSIRATPPPFLFFFLSPLPVKWNTEENGFPQIGPLFFPPSPRLFLLFFPFFCILPKRKKSNLFFSTPRDPPFLFSLFSLLSFANKANRVRISYNPPASSPFFFFFPKL